MADLKDNNDGVELQLSEGEFERLNQISTLGTNLYNQARALMMVYIQTLSGDNWKFTGQDILKFEIDPDGYTVRVSKDEPKT